MNPNKTTNVKISLRNDLLSKFQQEDLSLTQLLNKLLSDHLESKNGAKNDTSNTK